MSCKFFFLLSLVLKYLLPSSSGVDFIPHHVQVFHIRCTQGIRTHLQKPLLDEESALVVIESRPHFLQDFLSFLLVDFYLLNPECIIVCSPNQDASPGIAQGTDLPHQLVFIGSFFPPTAITLALNCWRPQLFIYDKPILPPSSCCSAVQLSSFSPSEQNHLVLSGTVQFSFIFPFCCLSSWYFLQQMLLTIGFSSIGFLPLESID